MSNNTIVIAIMGLLLSMLMLSKKDVVEGWDSGVPMGVKVMSYVTDGNGQQQALGNNFNLLTSNPSSVNNKFVSYPNFGASVQPRFSNVGYGSTIKYNMPDSKNLAVSSSNSMDGGCCSQPTTPIVENFDSVDGVPSCQKGGITNLNMQQNNNKVSSNVSMYNSAAPNMTAGGFTSSITDTTSDGRQENVVVMNELMYSNTKSRLASRGDQIRGDLPIVPCQTGWFQVSVTPNIDLAQGAMAVMGGTGDSDSTSRATTKLVLGSTAGMGKTTVGGVAYNMGNDIKGFLNGSTGGEQLRYTSFP